MKIFDALKSEVILTEINAFHTITSNINNQNNETYDEVIELQGKKRVIEHERKCRKALFEVVSSHKKNIKSSKAHDGMSKIRELTKTSYQDKKQMLENIKKDLQTENNRKNSAIAEVNKFREKNKLTHAAHYPENREKLYGILLLMGVLEAILNAFFLSKGSEFGLAGGFAMAIIISGVNILIAFFMSRSLMHIHHIEPRNSLLGILGTFGAASCLGFISLFIGHYRAALDQDNISASSLAVNTILESPLGISTFDSWMLVIITIAIFIFVTFKFYKNDEPYPGYGDISRKAENAKNKFSRIKTKANEMVQNIRTDLKEELEQEYENLNSIANSFDEDEESLSQLRRDYLSFMSQQSLEFESFCQECRQRFTHDCIQLLDKKSILPDSMNSITFDELELFLTEQDIAHQKELKQKIKNFRENEYSDIRNDFLSIVNQLVLEKDITA
ncbi:hypothetical protein [Colwellia sp. PAMC 21821]|uniref:hypothetical protein n=1 Tax=Colwellia sp. PAMC 21821 TaxID=1816219 RepID=UPI0009C100CE|nr:hypothetical protein [Colwellia sp. PAMC 21821]ARD45115.1 hypothetical protein A3Q33_12820 [Colwellia sp. PAMC 21821]